MKDTEQYFPVVLFILLSVQGGFNFYICARYPKM